MRKTFANLLKKEIELNPNIIILTADLGYKLWDEIKEYHPSNFINVGSAEQLMIGMAIGMTYEKKIPICYSITPFLLARPFELLRNYVNRELAPVKLVGSGRGYEYDIDGFTHWAQDDETILSIFPYIKIFKPKNLDELDEIFNDFIYDEYPCYLSLSKQIL